MDIVNADTGGEAINSDFMTMSNIKLWHTAPRCVGVERRPEQFPGPLLSVAAERLVPARRAPPLYWCANWHELRPACQSF